MKKAAYALLLTLCVGLSTSGCDSHPAKPTDPDELSVSDDVRVLSADELTGLVTASPGYDVLTFERRRISDEIESGDVLVAGVAPQLPRGLLRVVTEVEYGTETVTVRTSAATLEDVFTSGTVQFDLEFGPEDVVDVTPLGQAVAFAEEGVSSVPTEPSASKLNADDEELAVDFGYKLGSGLDVSGGVDPSINSDLSLSKKSLG